MNARISAFQYTKNLNYNKIRLTDEEETFIRNPDKGLAMLKQIQKYPVGMVVQFCDREYVFDATVIDSSIPGQVSVIDKQGFIHIGKIEEADSYDVMTMVSVVNKYKAGYNPEKMGGELFIRH